MLHKVKYPADLVEIGVLRHIVSVAISANAKVAGRASNHARSSPISALEGGWWPQMGQGSASVSTSTHDWQYRHLRLSFRRRDRLCVFLGIGSLP